jgi:hypothetical protein
MKNKIIIYYLFSLVIEISNYFKTNKFINHNLSLNNQIFIVFFKRLIIYSSTFNFYAIYKQLNYLISVAPCGHSFSIANLFDLNI